MDLQPAWDAAIAACLQGHVDCTYGGPTPGTGYWLAAEGCTENHGQHCAWCPSETVTGFAGWADDGWSIWGVPACREHADAWIAEHSEWDPNAEPEPRKTTEDLLAEMSPFAQGVAEAYNRAMAEALFGTAESCGEPREFGGLLSALGMDEEGSGPSAGLRGQDLDVAMAALFPEATAEPLFPEGTSQIMHSFLATPEPSGGPPYVHTFKQSDPVPLLDDDGQPVLDEAGEPVTFVPSRPSYTLTHTVEPTLSSHVSLPPMRDLIGPHRFGTPILPTFLPILTPEQRVAQILDAAGWTDRRLAGLPPLDPREGFTGVMILPPRRDQDRRRKRGKHG